MSVEEIIVWAEALPRQWYKSDLFEVENLKELLSSEFGMKDLGEAKKVPGMKIMR